MLRLRVTNDDAISRRTSDLPWHRLQRLGAYLKCEPLRRYFERDLGWGRGHQSRAVFDFLQSAAHFGTGGVVLDAGAGHQRYKPFFRDSLYIAQEHPEAGAKNKRLTEYDILADVRTIPLEDRCVDLVLSTSSLEHLEFPDAFFCEARRVLRPGGALYVHVPFLLAEHEKPYDFQRPTSHGLERHYRHAGFERIIVHPDSSPVAIAGENALLAIRLAAGGRGVFAKAEAFVPYALTWLATRVTSALLDRGPTPGTIMTAGWLAVGYTPGEFEPRVLRYATARDFVEACRR